VTLAAPFPYFGGKRRAAGRIWQALGDPASYVEPFAGSAAVLLARPPFTGRRVETLNDADGWLVNCWRAIQLSPDAVAAAALGPVAEIDYHARLAWLQARRSPDLVAWLEGDPEHHDAKAAGWWLYVMACGIGDPFGAGPWRVVDGHLRKIGRGNAGQGINRELPHLGDAGKGINREQDLRAYMRRLAERLQRVRITCGSWERVVKPSVIRSGTGGDDARAIFLDPPYATSGDLYAESSEGVAEDVRAWCEGVRRDLRVILCGYDSEHDALLAHGWSVIEGKSGRGDGYSTNRWNGRRERLWLSPACIGNHQPGLLELLEDVNCDS
jgi:site-specific DNA-adenine methylase